MHGLSYESVSDEVALKGALESFYVVDNKPKLLEVFTPKRINDTVLLNYFEVIK